MLKCSGCDAEFRLLMIKGGRDEAEFCPFCGEQIFENSGGSEDEDDPEYRYYDYDGSIEDSGDDE